MEGEKAFECRAAAMTEGGVYEGSTNSVKNCGVIKIYNLCVHIYSYQVYSLQIFTLAILPCPMLQLININTKPRTKVILTIPTPSELRYIVPAQIKGWECLPIRQLHFLGVSPRVYESNSWALCRLYIASPFLEDPQTRMNSCDDKVHRLWNKDHMQQINIALEHLQHVDLGTFMNELSFSAH